MTLTRMEHRARILTAGIGLTVIAGMLMMPEAALSRGQMQTGSHQTGDASASAAGRKSPLGSADAMDNVPSPFPDNNKQKRNDERQRRLVNDTQRLLTLTTQLKEEVASSGAEKMTPEMQKQMEEIEKLARSVKDKMRD